MRMRKPSFRHGVRVSIIASLFGLFILAMSGCGSASGGSTSDNPSSTNAVTQTVVPSASATSASKAPTALATSTTPGTKAILNCGTIRISATPIVVDAKTRDAKECFWHAYQQCQAATLTVNFTGVDTITRRILTLSQGTPCHVTVVVQHSIVPQPVKTTGNYSCGSIDRTSQALVIKTCGKDGDITIPLS